LEVRRSNLCRADFQRSKCSGIILDSFMWGVLKWILWKKSIRVYFQKTRLDTWPDELTWWNWLFEKFV